MFRILLLAFLSLVSLLEAQTDQSLTPSAEKAEEKSNSKESLSSSQEKAETKENKKESLTSKEAKKDEPPPIGNFALPASQQPSGLVAFGGNIIDSGEVQIYMFADDFVGRRKQVIDIFPNIVFGITDSLSLLFAFPFTPQFLDDGHRSSGLEDFLVQFEYAFYTKKNKWCADQATIVTGLTIPTGSVHKNPPTGTGSPGFFIGATYMHECVDWFVFTCPGAFLTTENHHTKLGNQFLYQFGIGHNIPSPPGWIYACMVEVDGQYNQKNRFKGKIDPNSGGNVIIVTPSLWFSTKDMLVQFGLGFPILQNLFGKQNKIDYVFTINVAWSFY